MSKQREEYAIRNEGFTMKVDVKIWKIDYSRFRNQIKILKSKLSKEEKKRASRFMRPYLENNYIIRHAILRYILSHELKVLPEKIVFCSHFFGKPFVANYSALHFNLSSSNEMGVIALSWVGEVGVDIEYLSRPQFSEAYLIDFFPWVKTRKDCGHKVLTSEEEMCVLWTKYEALSKSTGRGIGFASNGWDLLPKIFENTRTYHDIPKYKYSFGLTNRIPNNIQVECQEVSHALLT